MAIRWFHSILKIDMYAHTTYDNNMFPSFSSLLFADWLPRTMHDTSNTAVDTSRFPRCPKRQLIVIVMHSL